MMKLKIQKRFAYLSPLFTSFLGLIVCVITLIDFDLKNERLIHIIIFYSIVIMGTIYCFIYAGIMYQTIELKDQYIYIRNIFYMIKKVHIKEIDEVRILTLPTATQLTRNLFFNWIIFYLTDADVDVKYGGVNKKKNEYFQVIYSKENAEKLNAFFANNHVEHEVDILEKYLS